MKLMLRNFMLLSLCVGNIQIALADGSDVRVSVRAIRASNCIHENSQSTGSFSVDPHLADLTNKLERLPYRKFQLIGSKEQAISFRRKDVLALPNGQTLAFRPMYMDNRRVGLWLNWRDSGGSDILNTRIHFDSDEVVLTGTEATADSGVILAIKADPSQ